MQRLAIIKGFRTAIWEANHINVGLEKALGKQKKIFMGKKRKFVKIEVFIPEAFVDKLRERLNKVGAGHIGNYDHCLSVTTVKGYWRPLADAIPYDGEIGKVSFGEERKIEVNCPEEKVEEALKAIREIHPYDRPLINIIKLLNHKKIIQTKKNL